MNLLELMSDEEIQAEIEQDKNSFTVKKLTEDEADEILSKIIWADKKIKENEEKIKRKKKELENNLDMYARRLNGSLIEYTNYQKTLLKGYLEEQLGNKKGTLKLFHGNIRLKNPTESVVVDSDSEKNLVKYLTEKKYTDCLSTKTSVLKTGIKNRFKKDPSGIYFMDGEDIVQGVRIQKSSEGLEFAYTPAKSSESKDENVA